MCRSVPQMPVLWTRMSTSLMPALGSGTSWSQRPGSDFALTRAFMKAGKLEREKNLANKILYNATVSNKQDSGGRRRASATPSSGGGAGGVRYSGGRPEDREQDGHRGTDADRALQRNFSTVLLHTTLDHDEPQ